MYYKFKLTYLPTEGEFLPKIFSRYEHVVQSISECLRIAQELGAELEILY